MTFNNNIGGLHTSPIKAALNVIPKKKKKNTIISESAL